MAFNRTVNYQQNVPTNLGFNNYFDEGTARNVSVSFIMNPNTTATSKMGRIDFPVDAGVVIDGSKSNVNSPWHSQYTVSGPVANVNACLNACQYVSHFYDIETIQQDMTALDRNKGTCRGELCLQVVDSADISSISEGMNIRLSVHASPNFVYYVTRIDTTPHQKRIWCMYKYDYNLDDTLYGSEYRKIAKYMYIQNLSGTNIAQVNDISLANPYGNWTMQVSTFDPAEEINTIRLLGRPYIDEPIFVQDPPVSANAPNEDTWYNLSTAAAPWAKISQAANNYQSIQLLIKVLQNDPAYLGVADYPQLPGYPTNGTADEQLLFIGNALDTKITSGAPVYITDAKYGIFGDIQVGAKASFSYFNKEVKLNFYSIPPDCNTAFERITYYRPIGFTKDFEVETRIVNSRTRIYRNR